MGRIFGSGCGAGMMVFCMIGGIVLFTVGMTLGIIGAAMYPGEKRWSDNGETAQCAVTYADLYTTVCGSKYRYICYYAGWTVNFLTQPDADDNNSQTNVTTIIYDNKRGSTSYALTSAQRYPIGTTQTCWYDSSNLAKARWNSPNPSPYLGLLIAGWVMFFIGIILGVLSFMMICSS